MTCLEQIRRGNVIANEYATTEDFCRTFSENLNSFYQLSLLLTGDFEKAKECFLAGLEDAAKANVFKEKTYSRAKRAIIENAIHALRPHPGDPSPSVAASLQRRSAMESLLGLRDFDRFVFVMAVLEHYSAKECSVLLGCSLDEVRASRIRALGQLASSLEVLDVSLTK